MKYMFLIFDYNIKQNKVIPGSLVDQETGECFSISHFLKENEDITLYIDDLDCLFIYLVKELLNLQFINKANRKELIKNSFSFAYKNGKCPNVIVKNENAKIYFVNFKSKFGVDFQSDYNKNKELLLHAISKHREGLSLGSDAYNEFLLTLFKYKEDNNANHKLIRENFPIINDSDLNKAKNVCAGYQWLKHGYYNNIYEYDQSSAYASELQNNLPCGEIREFQRLQDIPETYFYVVKFIYIDKKLKAGKIDFLLDSNIMGEIVLPEPLFKLFQENYQATIKITRIMAFKTRKSMFSKFLYNTVILGKLLEDNSLIAKYNKLISNSLTGYFGKNTKTEASIIEFDGIRYKRKQVKIENDPIYLPVYLAVQSRQKAKFIRTLQKYKNKIVYANTDGFLTSEKIDINELNNYKTSCIGLYKEKNRFNEIFIECINGYVGKTDCSIESKVSGFCPNTTITPKMYQDKTFSYTIRIINPEGYVEVKDVQLTK